MTMEAPLPPILKGRKVSEVFIEYIQPILELVADEPRTPSAKEIERRLQVPWVVWNAVVLKEQDPSKDYLAEARKLLAKELAPMRAILESFVERKQRHFSQYKYQIGDYKVLSNSSGELSIRAEARGT